MSSPFYLFSRGGSHLSAVRLGSHLRQNLDKFVLITKKSAKFLSSVDHTKCDLLVSTRTKTCPWRQIFIGTVFLPRNTTFCEQKQKIVFLVINLSVNSVNLIFFRFTFRCDLRIVQGKSFTEFFIKIIITYNSESLNMKVLCNKTIHLTETACVNNLFKSSFPNNSKDSPSKSLLNHPISIPISERKIIISIVIVIIIP